MIISVEKKLLMSYNIYGDIMKNKVVIVGCGNVGMSYAYALLNQRTSVNELVLIDLNMERVNGEVMDLNHCLAFAPSKIDIKAGTYDDCREADIVVIAAGANQNPGETRMDLINKNSKIFKSIVGSVMQSGFNGIFLVATNPLDVMTYLTWKYSGLPSNKVIGSGTSLDTARLRYLIGDRLKINPKNVHAYVIGEHGDSEIVPWSQAYITTKKVYDIIDSSNGKFNFDDLYKISQSVTSAAQKIIKAKSATYYGIGMSLVRIVRAIFGDEKSALTVSVMLNGQYGIKDVYAGLPAIIGRNGIE